MTRTRKTPYFKPFSRYRLHFLDSRTTVSTWMHLGNWSTLPVCLSLIPTRCCGWDMRRPKEYLFLFGIRRHILRTGSLPLHRNTRNTGLFSMRQEEVSLEMLYYNLILFMSHQAHTHDMLQLQLYWCWKLYQSLYQSDMDIHGPV